MPASCTGFMSTFPLLNHDGCHSCMQEKEAKSLFEFAGAASSSTDFWRDNVLFLLDEDRCCSYAVFKDAVQTMGSIADALQNLDTLPSLLPPWLDAADAGPLSLVRVRWFLYALQAYGVSLQVMPKGRGNADIRGWDYRSTAFYEGMSVSCVHWIT